MKSLLLGLMIAMSAALPAAAEWQHIGDNESETSFYIDDESIREINGGYQYSEMLISESQNKYLVVQEQMLCRERATRITGYESYTRNGKLIQSRQIPNDKFGKIVIDTVKATLWEKLCN
ncbi:hypothetical protein ANSO36C_27310 [Nostoc cf. commune SO-36]|uniref:Surface-adhesin protein E-like domain-containing protein n=1 Tax=Nostoc cf. commune SO-36 TaxID=449208 RepID=A0ABM7Z1T7_NOSCO|nr:surface-adhesin E family protein [Nostoc commune]BDI16929.1 hypothetical protein ANSO36C_27310 [Nostoc cf. commune SO-36]